MNILVSSCLLGCNCKYNGGNNYNQNVIDLSRNHTLIPVCAEVMGGLSTPRLPSEIVNGVVTMKDGHNVDKEFRSGAQKALKTAIDNNVSLAILKSKSPSCGCKEIYDGTFTGTLKPGMGILAQMLTDHGIPVLTESETDRIY